MKIVVVGCGTTGNVIIPKLKGNILIIDRDIVEEKNLNRQVLFTKTDVNKPKAEVIGKKLNLRYNVMDLDYTNVSVLNSDLVIDCTDNLETRFLINEYCMKNKIPWIYTGIVGDLARVMYFDGKPCFRCIFSEVKGLATCSTDGVDLKLAEQLSKIVIKEINKPSKKLWANGDLIKVNSNPKCPVCNKKYEYLDGKKESIIKFCGSSRFQFKGEFDYKEIKKRVNKDFFVFKDRILVKADTEKEAKKKFTEFVGL
jgi:adenylyltransferase/sulfurtransferase